MTLYLELVIESYYDNFQSQHVTKLPKLPTTAVKHDTLETGGMTLVQMFQCCQLYDSGQSIKQLSKKYQQEMHIINNILQVKKSIVSSWINETIPYKARKENLADLSEAMIYWYIQRKTECQRLRGVDIQAKAQELASTMGHNRFQASNGMLLLHDLKQYLNK
mgnify:FL=1